MKKFVYFSALIMASILISCGTTSNEKNSSESNSKTEAVVTPKTPPVYLDDNGRPKEVLDCYQELIRDGFLEYAHQELKKVHQEIMGESGSGIYCNAFRKEDMYKYYFAIAEVYSAEFKQIIASDDPNVIRKLALFISDVTVDGSYEAGVIKAGGYYEESGGLERQKCSIIAINKICSNTVSYAIAVGNRTLAETALMWFQQDLDYTRRDNKTEWDRYDYTITCSYKSRDNAKKRIEEAIASGLL